MSKKFTKKDCKFPFKWYGKDRSECVEDKKTKKKFCIANSSKTKNKNEKVWCRATKKKLVIKEDTKPKPPVIKKNKTVSGKDCKFPFKFYNKMYNECYLNKKTSKYWCATETKSDGSIISKDNCEEDKPLFESNKTVVMTKDGKRCIFPYTYYGKPYNECNKWNSWSKEYECPTKIVKGKIVERGICDLDLPVNKIEQKKAENNNNINILFKDKSKKKNEALWVSSMWNNLLAFLYLYNKFDNVCKPFIKKFTTGTYHISGFNNFQIYWGPTKDKVKTKIKTVEDVKKEFVIHYIQGASNLKFIEHLKKCKKKRYIIVQLYIVWASGDSAHANMLIFDNVKKTCERFEPYGNNGWSKNAKKVANEWLVEEAFDSVFQDFLGELEKKHKLKYNYMRPVDYCPEKAYQFYNDFHGKHYPEDPGGYCGMWSIWWADLRLSNPNKSQKELIDISLDKIKNTSKDFTDFIRNYGNFVQMARNDALDKFKLPKKLTNSILRKTKKDTPLQFTAFRELVRNLDLVIVD